MYRTNSCGALRKTDIGDNVTLSGWVQSIRNTGYIIWVDLRDRYGITQLVFDKDRSSQELLNKVQQIGREFVIRVKGEVVERQSKNDKIPTGDIEVQVSELETLNTSELPPFTIEDETDGGEVLRMKYRYLDIRRNPIRDNLIFRHKVTLAIRNYLSEQGFIDVETPFLIKSTPEGARDFIVPSRIHPGQFFALPQSPQTFKQLLMVGGLDKYYQIVKCFRDEDLRADRQPEFTQIDCEMSFVTQEDVLETFEGMTATIFKAIRNIDLGSFVRMTYQEAMETYGSDKPDIRFDMKLKELTSLVKGKGFQMFEKEYIGAISVSQKASMTRKDLDQLTDWVKQPQIGAKGLIWLKYSEEGNLRSSVDKFFTQEELSEWVSLMDAQKGDLILILSGDKQATRNQLGALRLHIAEQLGLRNSKVFAPLWITDFPLLEWDEEAGRYHAMHHPFTSPKLEDLHLLETDPGAAKANAYDLVINGNEIGGGSLRIYDQNIQERMFKCLGFSKEEAQSQFGFLLEAFKYGAPPHGGIAFGLDRFVSILRGQESIRDFIAFPKNNSARDVMLNAPDKVSSVQLDELGLTFK